MNLLRHDRNSKAAPRRRRGERGSAFTVALLVLLVLTISGLAVTLMTQTEVRIGSNERTANRNLFAADSGIEIATAKTTASGIQPALMSFQLNTTNQDTSLTLPTSFADQVTVTPLLPISTQYCDLCMVNTGSSSTYTYVNFAVNSTAIRTGTNSTGGSTTTQTVASKTLSTFVALTPQPIGYGQNPNNRYFTVVY